MSKVWTLLIFLFLGLLVLNVGRFLTGTLNSFTPVLVSVLGLVISFTGFHRSPLEKSKI